MWALIFFFFVVLILFARSIRTCRANERFVVMRLGRTGPPSGPGIIIFLPVLDRVFRIQEGDRGQLISSSIVLVNNVEFPCRSDSSMRAGSFVRIIGFEGGSGESVARVALDSM